MAFIAIDMTPMRPGGENGGVKFFALELIKGFQAVSRNNKFLLLTAFWNDDELSSFDSETTRRLRVLDKQGVEIHTSNPIMFRLERILRRMYRVLKRYYREKIHRRDLLSRMGVDVLFCPFAAPTYAEPGIPVVSVVCDLQHKDYPQFFSSAEITAREALIGEVQRRADAIVCISENTRQSVIRHLKIDPDRTCTIHISIQSRLAESERSKMYEHLQELPIPDAPFMYYPANFWPHKNHEMLIAAYEMFLLRNPDSKVDLVFTGTLDSFQQSVRDEVRRRELDGRVHFLGYLPEEQLIAVWKGCSFLIFPSLYEGFGIPVLEAWHFGKPVLCSNVTSLPEVAGNAALYFDPRKPPEMVQCMERILADQELYADLVNRGYQRLSSFSPHEMIEKYLRYMEDVLRKQGPWH